MNPILFSKNEKNFNTFGLGVLRDTVSCTVEESVDNTYELTLQYPVDSEMFSKIKIGGIIKSLANDDDEPQLFRIYYAEKPINKICTFRAFHISYDLSGYPILPNWARSGNILDIINQALEYIPIAMEESFVFTTNIESYTAISLSDIVNLREFIISKEFLNKNYGYELHFNNFNVNILSKRGKESSYVIRYGKDLTDFKQEENISKTYTHFLPYAIKKTEGHEETVYIPGKVMTLTNVYPAGIPKVFEKDLSSEFDEDQEMTPSLLVAKASKYAEENKLTVPEVSFQISFVPVWQTAEYRRINFPPAKLALGDSVKVEFPDIGVFANARIVKTVYDALTERYLSLEVGDVRKNIADTIYELQERSKKI